MLQPTPDGIILEVRVIPRASKSGVAGTRGDALLVRLHAPPLEGAANTELIRVIPPTPDVPPRAVSIIAGEHSRQKRLRIVGIDAATATSKLGQRPS